MKGTARRVAITGYDVVSPCGQGRDQFWAGLLGPGLVDVGYAVGIADWDPSPFYDSPKKARRADSSEQFAIAAATGAIDQAGDFIADPTRVGTIIGTGVGGVHTLETQVRNRLERGERRVSPFLVPMMMANAAGAAISMRFGLRGPNETLATACAAGTHALTYAARLIAWGIVDAVVAGGTEDAATPTAVAGFANMTALSSSGTSRPFDVDRDGFVMGAGAAIFVLEEWDAAVARGATILGEVLGGASTADAHHITAPAPGGIGAIECMSAALADADLEPSAITQINAHGTSTPLNDAAEAAAITSVFGARTVPVVSTKGVTGHALGAAGALEAAAVLSSFEHRQIPPTANTQTIDDEIDIDLVINEPRDWTPGPTMSNNFGFGGHNGSIILAPAS
ncbi:MAG: beta-ketoacyl synthase [Ilumatobacter coccineus]|uniref:Beta-ketoacyl synthase n=1 Tax=Ilumatobacter coccineus TaxID=467094 RepID=A0A2G6K9Q3_9ACTN|nr:MAG: beta-ketoacyl synthase [Ilumatobacter coccineus]